MYTTSETEIGTTTFGDTGDYGYTYQGIAGYCFPDPKKGMVPLHRYIGFGEHFYTTDTSEVVEGYTKEDIACYVVPVTGRIDQSSFNFHFIVHIIQAFHETTM